MLNGFAADLARFGPGGTGKVPGLSWSRSYCSRLARTHYENFTVASLLLPRRLLPHFHAIYAYCRWADDLGDETGGGQEALDLLEWWRQELMACYERRPRHPVMVALAATIDRFRIPPKPFLDLLLAFEQDQRVKRYQTFEELLGYCQNSANPVGHLVLYLSEAYDLERARLSDCVCTGLQLANFWQDVARDFDIGRVYLPAEDRQRFGYSDVDLESRHCTREFVELMRFEVERTRDFFQRGLPLVEQVPIDVRLDIELFIQGGLAILSKIERLGFDVWKTRPALSKAEKALLFGKVFGKQLINKSKGVSAEPRVNAPSFSLASCGFSLSASFIYCRQVVRRSASSFYPAFWLLPRNQRQAMCALYTFLRITDDLSDSLEAIARKREQLHAWRWQLRRALAGEYSHPLHAALHHTVTTFGIPTEYLEEAINGVEMDLEIARYQTFDELYRYCYRVASVVGLSCIRIWGCSDARAKEYAEAAGIAFQLTNILRDLAEDAARDRLYLPLADLARFGYSETQLLRGERTEAFRSLMRFEVERARTYYLIARSLTQFLDAPGQAVFCLMMNTYRALLEKLEQRDYDVFSGRVTLSTWRKLALAARVLPARLGWPIRPGELGGRSPR